MTSRIDLMKFVQLLLLLEILLACVAKSVSGGTCEKLVDNTANSTCYDKDLRPLFGAAADFIGFGIHVYQIGPISESSMSMSSDLYVRAFWNDHRLTAMAKRLSSNESADATVIVKGHYAAAIWRPNIYFVDAVEEDTPSEVSQSKITLLKTNGDVLSSTRILIKTRCPLQLGMFPLDTQECPICFSSYMYNDAEQQVYWLDDNVEMDDTLSSTATFFIDPQLKHDTKVNSWSEGANTTVRYTTLCMRVRFKRKWEIYVVTMFLPSISLVVLSWVSFCIDKNAVPARAGITITTILAQITLITGTANKFPGIADLKIGDVYMIGNFFFVFGSLIEFALVNSGQRRRVKSRKRKESKVVVRGAAEKNKNTKNYFSCDMQTNCDDEERMNGGDNDDVDGERRGDSPRTKRRRFVSHRAITQANIKLERGFDFWALIIFPTTFLLWHAGFAVYCAHYMSQY
ncbi:gamma-aminobutyric acid receptor subunit rho-1-like isoform X2 [Symsagittifera roscoffensis]|uniref:gamma-aminobutyric acid receptor subunit rho-1-like isoform X2 n=1 Tax=Symsagittifera roscoffensis TaxID=84072 RepID=UPI00307B59D8